VTSPPDKSSTHERYRDDLAAYALGALRDADADELRHHLEGCEACRDRLRWLQPAVDVLPSTVEQMEPPPQLRSRLLATVRAEAGKGTPAAAAAVRRGRRREWAALLWRPATAVAAGAILIAGVAGGYLLHQPGESSSVVAVVPSSPGSTITGTLEREDGSAILRMAELPMPPKGDVYEAWVERDGATEPASLFEPSRDRTAEAAVAGPLEGADAVLVTREPRGGSTQPTSRPLLRADLN
jgi:anti-sigma-K factor RskA